MDWCLCGSQQQGSDKRRDKDKSECKVRIDLKEGQEEKGIV
jgi:hypothetical protein